MIKLPWISRAVHSAELRARDREIELLTRELSYYREKFEAEKERADRAIDTVLETAGREPISQPVRAEKEERVDAALAMQSQVEEVFADVAGSLSESLAEKELPEEPEAPEPSIEQRLSAIRKALPPRKPEYPTGLASAAPSSGVIIKQAETSLPM